MKIWIGLSGIAILALACTNIYVPGAMRGSQVVKEIEEARATGSFGTLPILMGSTTASSTNSTNVACNVDSSAVPSLAATTTAANFSIPTSLSRVDLKTATTATDGTHYFFRSRILDSDVGNRLRIRNLITTVGTTPPQCTYVTGTNVCGNTDLSTAFTQPTTILSANNTDITVSVGHCLAVRCEGQASLRLKFENPVSASQGNVSIDVTGTLIGPEIFNAMAGIKKNKYYTRASVQACKDMILLINLMQVESTTQAMASYQRNLTLANSCNDLLPSFQPGLDNLTAYFYQGAICNIEEAGDI